MTDGFEFKNWIIKDKQISYIDTDKDNDFIIKMKFKMVSLSLCVSVADNDLIIF